jgi:hypothetical protein
MKRFEVTGFRALLVGSSAAALAMSLGACKPSVEVTGGTGGSNTGGSNPTGGAGGGPLTIVARVDLVLAIDNSRSMADKQQILALAVPDLVESLVNPPCVDPASGLIEGTPAGPFEACPAGAQRRFAPIVDIHVGIISSSLGGHGSDACSVSGPGKQSNNDKAHLLARVDPTSPGEVETYQNLKFLAWDPEQKLAPPGEADIATDSGIDGNATALVPQLRDMVIGVGQVGCGYESQLESWYRFLVEPDPPEEVTLDGDGTVLLKGIDNVLLEQRKAFLRPDSALAILMLTDENDCSIRESGQFYYAAQQMGGSGTFHLPAARAVCAQSPGDECCFSCGQKGPKNDDGSSKCDVDPTCKTADGKTVFLDDLADTNNLRCFDQKRRFGIDFLYPIDRYVAALASSTVTNRNGEVVPNPLFSDLDPNDGFVAKRDPGLVFLAGLVGVPWQDLARTNANGNPDVKSGLDGAGQAVGGYKTAAELAQTLPGKSFTTWDLILGDFDHYGAAQDPHMHESVEQRSGSNPITGDPLVTSATPLANKINGHEWSIKNRDDLQYACIFPIVKVDANGNVSPDIRDCSNPGTLAGCDCEDNLNDNPLCQVNPATGNPTDQVRAKAYPGLRQLAVLKGLGGQGVVASVCPAQLVQPADSDFGYRPAMAALVEALKAHFQ